MIILRMPFLKANQPYFYRDWEVPPKRRGKDVKRVM